jgi:hypothetical protein
MRRIDGDGPCLRVVVVWCGRQGARLPVIYLPSTIYSLLSTGTADLGGEGSFPCAGGLGRKEGRKQWKALR